MRVQLQLFAGWGSTAAVWDAVRSCLQREFDLLVEGEMADPARPLVLAGWSLGGWEALDRANGPGRADAVLLVASNPSFVRRPGWSEAMAPEAVAGFGRGFRLDPEGALRRFTALQALDDEQARRVRRQLLAEGLKSLEEDREGLARGLERLYMEDWRGAFHGCPVPLGVILGRRDRLVPVTVADALAACRPGLWLEIMDGCGHAPFLSRPQAFAEGCRRFVDHALSEARS